MSDTIKTNSRPILLAGVVAAIGATLLYMGAQLAIIGGSLYYLIAGCVLLLCAVLLIKAKPHSALLYGLFSTSEL